MKKKLEVQFLDTGMYVSELDRPWIGTPFLFQGFEISSDEHIKQLQQFCKYVYIDTDEGKDYIPSPHNVARKDDLIVNKRNEEQEQKIEFELLKQAASPQANIKQAYDDTTTLEEEVESIKDTHRFAHQLIQEIFEDVRLG